MTASFSSLGSPVIYRGNSAEIWLGERLAPAIVTHVVSEEGGINAEGRYDALVDLTVFARGAVGQVAMNTRFLLRDDGSDRVCFAFHAAKATPASGEAA